MTTLNLNSQTRSNTVAIAAFLETCGSGIAHFSRMLFSNLALHIQKTRKSPEDILAAKQRRNEAQLRVDRLLSHMH